jgi:hypothetical protein
MDSSFVSVPSRFADRILQLMERVEHRVARTDAEREAVYRLRYDAYLKNGLLTPRADGQLRDERYDTAANARIVMTFIDGELAGTTRVNVAASVNDPLPAFGVYPDIVGPHLRAGQRLVEMTRLAASPAMAHFATEIPYVTLRAGFMAAGYFNGDFTIATPRGEHMAFYRRVFCFVQWCEPREYPGLTAKFGCMAMDYRAVQKGVTDRYPFFRSTPAECEALFGPIGEPAVSGASVAHDGAPFEAAAGASAAAVLL